MENIQLGLTPVREATTLQAFLQGSVYEVLPDGNFGPGTEEALKQFQQMNDFIVDRVVEDKIWTILFAKHPSLMTTMASKSLSQAVIANFADSHRLTVLLVRAVYAVESGLRLHRRQAKDTVRRPCNVQPDESVGHEPTGLRGRPPRHPIREIHEVGLRWSYRRVFAAGSRAEDLGHRRFEFGIVGALF